MNFADVEGLRQTCLEKRNKVRRRAVIVTLIAYCIFIMIAIFLNRDFIAHLINSIDSASSREVVFVLIPIVIAIVISVMIPAIIIAAVVSFSVKDEHEKYKKAYKAYFVEEQLRKYFADIKYSHTSGLDREILRRTGMIYTGDRYSSNDLTVGRHKNVGFMQADVHIEREHTDEDGNKSYSTVFLGRYMVFEFPKKFKS